VRSSSTTGLDPKPVLAIGMRKAGEPLRPPHVRGDGLLGDRAHGARPAAIVDSTTLNEVAASGPGSSGRSPRRQRGS
jgi:hypothetical protein